MYGNQKIIVSIIVPAYNVRSAIGRCLESIHIQDYKNFEVLCVDDGSTDDTVNIIREWEQIDPRIKLIVKKHGGQSRARNYGISAAKGEYVLFIDSDDVIAKNMLSKLLEKACQDGADVTISGICLRQKNKSVCNYVIPDFSGTQEEFMRLYFKEAYKKWLINAPWNKLIRKQLLLDYNLCFQEDMRIYEDLLFSLDVIKHSKKVSVVGESLYTYYYMTQGSVLSKFTDNVDRYIYRVGEKLEEIIPLGGEDISFYYADIVHKMVVYASSIRRYQKFSPWKKLKKVCTVFANEELDKYLNGAKAEDKVLKRQLFWIKKFRWIMKIVARC